MANRINPTRQAGQISRLTSPKAMLEQSLVWTLRKSLRDVIGFDTIEHNTVMRFLGVGYNAKRAASDSFFLKSQQATAPHMVSVCSRQRLMPGPGRNCQLGR